MTLPFQTSDKSSRSFSVVFPKVRPVAEGIQPRKVTTEFWLLFHSRVPRMTNGQKSLFTIKKPLLGEHGSLRRLPAAQSAESRCLRSAQSQVGRLSHAHLTPSKARGPLRKSPWSPGNTEAKHLLDAAGCNQDITEAVVLHKNKPVIVPVGGMRTAVLTPT